MDLKSLPEDPGSVKYFKTAGAFPGPSQFANVHQGMTTDSVRTVKVLTRILTYVLSGVIRGLVRECLTGFIRAVDALSDVVATHSSHIVSSPVTISRYYTAFTLATLVTTEILVCDCCCKTSTIKHNRRKECKCNLRWSLQVQLPPNVFKL